MKILMTADTVGGVWTYALQLARALRRHNVDVVLATMGRPMSREQREEARQATNVTVCESSYKLEWMDNPWLDVYHAGEWLLGLEERFAPDIIHLNGYVHADLPFRAPVLVVGHSCVLSWHGAVRGHEAPPHFDHYREEVRRGLRVADAVVTPTRAMLNDLERYYGPIRKSMVIPNAREAALYSPLPKENMVLAVGRVWDEAKNIEMLERVGPHLEWPVYVAGEERHPEGGAAELKHVQPLGHLSSAELACWYRRAAIYAHPARYEPFGLSALEAALAGCALVLGDISSLGEVWEDAAIFVPPNDPDALERAIHTLIGNPTLRAEKAARARQQASCYTPERMVSGYMQIYGYLRQKQTLHTHAHDAPGYEARYAS